MSPVDDTTASHDESAALARIPARRDLASDLLALAVWVLPAGRREWGEAMTAELACLEARAERRSFAASCLWAAVGAEQLVRLTKYLAFVAATIALLAVGGVTEAVGVEIVLVGLIAPLVVWRLGRRDGALGTVAPTRTARWGRRIALILAAVGLALAVGFLSSVVPPEGTPVLVVALAALVAVLAGYVALGYGLTAAASRAWPATLLTSGVCGAMSGLAWCVLMPFNRAVALPGGWSTAVPAALALVAVGLPAGAAVVVIRGSRDVGQGVLAGAGSGAFAGLLILIGGAATLWFFPVLPDTALLDRGPMWRPPDLVEQVIPSYFGVLLVAPALGAVVGWLVGRTFRPGRPVQAPALPAAATRAGAVVALVLLGLAALPYVSIMETDTTSFGRVGTTNVVFSPAGGTLLTANADYTWILWNIGDPAKPTRLATFNDEVRYSPDGRTLASRNVLWSLADTTRPVRAALLFGGGEPMAFSPDGRMLATHEGDEARLWDVTDRTHPMQLASFVAGEGALFSPTGRVLFTRDDDTVTVWDLADPRRPVMLSTLPAAGDWRLSPDGQTLAIVQINGPIDLWSVANPARPVRLTTISEGQKVAFAPGRVVATADNDGTVWLWSLPDATLVATLPPAPGTTHPQIGISDTLTVVAFSADGHTLATETGNTTASRWDITDPAHPVRLGTVIRHTNGAGQVAFSSDLSTVAGAAVDGSNSITLWRVA